MQILCAYGTFCNAQFVIHIIINIISVFSLLLTDVFDWHVRIHQRKKEGGTYSPREAEIIETKCKLDQLIAVADLELKQEKLNRLVCVITFNLRASLYWIYHTDFWQLKLHAQFMSLGLI